MIVHLSMLLRLNRSFSHPTSSRAALVWVEPNSLHCVDGMSAMGHAADIASRPRHVRSSPQKRTFSSAGGMSEKCQSRHCQQAASEVWTARAEPLKPYQRAIELPARKKLLTATLVTRCGEPIHLNAHFPRSGSRKARRGYDTSVSFCSFASSGWRLVMTSSTMPRFGLLGRQEIVAVERLLDGLVALARCGAHRHRSDAASS